MTAESGTHTGVEHPVSSRTPELVLCAVDESLARAWLSVLDKVDGSIRVHRGSVLDVIAQAIVSPANSFGLAWCYGLDAEGDASFLLYEDDGCSFNYRQGEWMGIEMSWNNAHRIVTMNLANGARMLPPLRRDITMKLDKTTRQVVFEGKPLEIKF